MTKTSDRYSVGNIIACIGAMLFSAALAWYALSDYSSGRIRRSWEFVTVMGVLGALACGWHAIKGIRSRMR